MNKRTKTGLAWPATLVALLFCVFTVGLAQASEKVSLKSGKMTLNANLELAEGKKISDGVVLVTHGTLAHNGMEIIKTMQALLSERGHSSLAINLSLGIDNRGSAMYDCKVPHKHLYLDAVDEISAWVGWLKSKGATKITVLGHSRGGAQTATYAAQKPDSAVGHVVLIAPAIWSQKHSEESYEKSYRTKLPTLLASMEKLVKDGKGDTMVNKTGILYCPDTKVTASAFVSYYKPDMRRHSPFLMKNIKLPTLVIAGANDTVVVDLPKFVKPLVDGKKLQLKVIEDADHYFRDFAAEEIADAVDEFLKN